MNFSANTVYADVLRESPSAAQVVTLLENLALEGRIMGAKVPCRRQSSRASADHSYFLATAAHDFNQRKAGDLMKGMSGCAPTDFYGRSHCDRSMRYVCRGSRRGAHHALSLCARMLISPPVFLNWWPHLESCFTCVWPVVFQHNAVFLVLLFIKHWAVNFFSISFFVICHCTIFVCKDKIK
jgi:hypothetical protein